MVIDFDGAYAVATSQAVSAAGGTPRIVLHEDVSRAHLESIGPTAVVLGACDLGKTFAFDTDVLALNVPFLGICNGAQLLACAAGGVVRPMEQPEDGLVELRRHSRGVLTVGMPHRQTVLMYHEHSITCLPAEIRITGSTSRSPIAAFELLRPVPLFGVQYHPENRQTPYGAALMRRFLCFSYVYGALRSMSSAAKPPYGQGHR